MATLTLGAKAIWGMSIWFSGDVMPDPVSFIEWAHRFIDGGRKLFIIGGLGMVSDRRRSRQGSIW